MLGNFSKRPVAIFMCIFFIVLISTTLDVASFDEENFFANESNMVYIVIAECDAGRVAGQLQHDVRINRNQFTYRHELPRKRF